MILIHSCCVVYCLQNLRSNTTAVVGMVTDLHLHMGWTGDSQIILVRRGVPAFASQPHKPEREVMSYREGQIYASTDVIRVSIVYTVTALKT